MHKTGQPIQTVGRRDDNVFMNEGRAAEECLALREDEGRELRLTSVTSTIYSVCCSLVWKAEEKCEERNGYLFHEDMVFGKASLSTLCVSHIVYSRVIDKTSCSRFIDRRATRLANAETASRKTLWWLLTPATNQQERETNQ